MSTSAHGAPLGLATGFSTGHRDPVAVQQYPACFAPVPIALVPAALPSLPPITNPSLADTIARNRRGGNTNPNVLQLALVGDGVANLALNKACLMHRHQSQRYAFQLKFNLVFAYLACHYGLIPSTSPDWSPKQGKNCERTKKYADLFEAWIGALDHCDSPELPSFLTALFHPAVFPGLVGGVVLPFTATSSSAFPAQPAPLSFPPALPQLVLPGPALSSLPTILSAPALPGSLAAAQPIDATSLVHGHGHSCFGHIDRWTPPAAPAGSCQVLAHPDSLDHFGARLLEQQWAVDRPDLVPARKHKHDGKPGASHMTSQNLEAVSFALRRQLMQDRIRQLHQQPHTHAVPNGTNQVVLDRKGRHLGPVGIRRGRLLPPPEVSIEWLDEEAVAPCDEGLQIDSDVAAQEEALPEELATSRPICLIM